MGIDVSKLSVEAVEAVDYDGNDAGYNRDYRVTVRYDDNDYILLFQPQEPVYLSAEWISRQSGGSDIDGFSLDPSVTDDDSFALIGAMKKVAGDDEGDDYDYLAAINAQILSVVDMVAV